MENANKVAVVPMGSTGVCVVVKSRDGGGGGTDLQGTFVECWNEGGGAGRTWIVPFDAKMKLRELRMNPGAMEQTTATPVAPNKAAGGVTNDSSFIQSIDDGTAMPWKEGMRPDTYLLEPDQLMLIVPSENQWATAPETDVLIGTSGGMVVSWAHGMKNRIVNSRHDYGRPQWLSNLLY